MTTAVIVQARTNSRRFPGKVMAKLLGKPVLWHVLTRCMAIPNKDTVVCAVPDEPASRPLAEVAKSLGCRVYMGPEDDVLARYAGAADFAQADLIARVTADCPLIDPDVCSHVIAAAMREDIDYASNVMPRTFEKGLDCEAFTRTALALADYNARTTYDREHVTPWIQRSPDIRRINVESGEPVRSRQNWCIDHPEDLEKVRGVMRSAMAA